MSIRLSDYETPEEHGEWLKKNAQKNRDRAAADEALEAIRSRMRAPRVFIEGKQFIVIPIDAARAIIEKKEGKG